MADLPGKNILDDKMTPFSPRLTTAAGECSVWLFDEFADVSREKMVTFASTAMTGLLLCMRLSHEVARRRGWWCDIHTMEPKSRPVPEMLMLMVTELAEAMEGFRKDLNDDKLPNHKMLTVELADVLHRVFDTAVALDLPLVDAFFQKAHYNMSRPDHDIDVRRAKGGKSV